MSAKRSIAVSFLTLLAVLLACWAIVSGAAISAHGTRHGAAAETFHEGTFEDPRLANEAAWKGAVFFNAAGQPAAFYIAAFDSQSDEPAPPFPVAPQSDASWTYAGQHSGIGPDLKPFDEPTRLGALHIAQIDSKNALLRSKIDGLPNAQTPYPIMGESNEHWEFLGFFEKPGTVDSMKNQQDLVWPGVYVFFDDARVAYLARRTGRPATDKWPAPDTQEGAAYWRYAGTLPAVAPQFAKPWSDRSVVLGSYYHNPQTALRHYYHEARFTGFPALLEAAFPLGAQSDSFWQYTGRHSGQGSPSDPRPFGEPASPLLIHRARIEGMWTTLSARFTGKPSSETPYPATLAGNDFWHVGRSTAHAGTWFDPKDNQDSVTFAGDIHAQPSGNHLVLYRSMQAQNKPANGWNFSDGKQFQLLGNSVHAGTVADPKGRSELTWPGAVHRADIAGKPVYFVSTMIGTQENWPLPATPASNEHWNYIAVIEPLGTFESPRQFNDYSQAGSVFVDGTVRGQRTFYVSSFEGYPADDIDGFSMVGVADPYWAYAGHHAGTLADLKPFADLTRIGAMHEGLIQGQRTLLRSRFAGMPSTSTPYPQTLASNDHWELVSVFKHAGTADDMKTRDDVTWPGALHLDEVQKLVFSSNKDGAPPGEGWVYPAGETSDANWTFVTSVAQAGTVDAPRPRNSLSVPGTVFVDQRGLRKKRLFKAKFAGFAAEVNAVYPGGSDSNEFYEYAGEHAGTFTDPKIFEEPTWPEAIHQTLLDGKLTFLKSKITGVPSQSTPYPQTPASNAFWEFMFVTPQAGTVNDPKSMSGTTWPGAIHQYSAQGNTYLVAAQQSGDPAQDNWPAPGTESAHWKTLGKVMHKGTFADPKGHGEFTSPGLIHADTIDGHTVFYRSLIEGVPEAETRPYPHLGTDNEHWQYLGRSRPTGTWDNPKKAWNFTWPGRIHTAFIGGKHLYLTSRVDGFPAEHEWPMPVEGENAYWKVSGESKHAGSFSDPKAQEEVTWVGALHAKQEGSMRTYYRSRVFGNLAEDANMYPLPQGPQDNDAWAFAGVTRHTGTLSDPMVEGEVTWAGAVHKTSRDTGDDYYTARFDGIVDNAVRPFPASGQSDSSWIFLGKHSRAGTLENPKDAHEITWPGLIHRYELNAKQHFVRSRFQGAPDPLGWQFPTSPDGDDRWEHLDMGIHAGNWEDLKPHTDATWPGALHVQSVFLGAPPKWRKVFYRSRFWGKPASDNLYPPYSDTQYWEPVGFSLQEGTLDSPKDMHQPTWRGAIHVDIPTGAYFEARKTGIIGQHLDLPPDTATDNDSWHFLGASRRLGTVQFPKQHDDFTWPGRVHLHEYAGKKLYFTPLMAGTPSQQGWAYPTDESSNEHWYFYGTTEHAGTYADPHQRNEVTWRGAIHKVSQEDRTLYFAALRAGNPEVERWPYPDATVDNSYFRYVALATHEGTLDDPRDVNELVTPGVFVKTRVGTEDIYFIAKSEGIPSMNDWPFPQSGNNSPHWEYYGSSRHAGTIEDPKEWNDVSRVGDVLVNDTGRMRLLFKVVSDSLPTGIPSNDGWTRFNDDGLDQPQEPKKNPGWKFLRVAQHKDGTLAYPKYADEWTLKGMIHETTISSLRMFFRSRFDGKMNDPAGGPEKSMPDADVSNQWWEFMSKGYGTQRIPYGWNDYSAVGDIHAYYQNDERWLFKSKKEGRPSEHNRYYPTSGFDDDNWEYLSRHEGTREDPKAWNENTAPGTLHRAVTADKTLFFSPTFSGNAAKHNYFYPTAETSNMYWTYQGSHLGTLKDPKVMSDPVWPGDVSGPSDQQHYFIAKKTGVPNDKGWAYPASATDNDYWRWLDTSIYSAPGINDFSMPFDHYTWVTAHNAYNDDLQEQLDRGIRGFMLDLHADENDSDRVLICHTNHERCESSSPALQDVLNVTFLPFLAANRHEVVTLQFESTVTRKAMEEALKNVPGLADATFAYPDGEQWPTLQQIIDSNKRLIMFSDAETGSYTVEGKPLTIHSSLSGQVENTFDLGLTAVMHDWTCKTRYPGRDLSLRESVWQKTLFVLNQFHVWGSTTVHAADVDNNLTHLQRRVEKYCRGPSGWRKPNLLAIDFNQVGDAFPYAAALTQGGYYFYEQNGADRDGDTTCVLPANQHHDAHGVQYDIRLGAKGCENDEIRSMEMEGVPAGTRIELYDSPSGDRQDDFTVIDVKQAIPMGTRVKIDSLEGSSQDFYHRKIALHNNGLDGKVSRIVVKRKPAGSADAAVVFHEGNNATQNIVCTVPLNKTHHFKMGAGNNDYGCDNDEIRSALILSAYKGSTFSVTGNPEGGFNQGLTSITVKRTIDVPVELPSFDSSFENDDIKVEVTHGGDLDGKISYAYFNGATEPPPEPPPLPDPGAPDAPQNFRVDGYPDDNSVPLTWDKSTGAVKYRVFKYFTRVGDTPDTSLTHTHPDSVAGRYHVVAFDERNRASEPSAYVWVFADSRDAEVGK